MLIAGGRMPPNIGGNDDYTKMLVHGDGVNGATSTRDFAAPHHVIGFSGSAAISTAQKKFGQSSILISSATDNSSFISLDGSTDFVFGTGDWTIEFWVYLLSVATVEIFYDGRGLGDNGAFPTIFWDGSNLTYFANSSARITGGALLVSNWYHIAVARAGTSTKMFLDGVQSGSTYSDSTNYVNGGAGRPLFGNNGSSASSHSVVGYKDGIRVTKGLARYTANFTPPKRPFG